MADGMELLLDAGVLDAASDKIARTYLRAGTRTIATVTRRTEQRLEQLTREAAGGKLWRAWQSAVYPKGDRPARNPAGEIWVKGRGRTDGAIKFWTEPGRIRGRNVEWLPVPLPAAGQRSRNGLLSPHEWEMRHPDWRLDLLWQDGKRPLLVAHRRLKRRETYGAGGRAQRGTGITEGKPIFALVRDRPFRNAFAIAPVLRTAEAEIAPEYARQARSATS
jgi:hypothetical protein